MDDETLNADQKLEIIAFDDVRSRLSMGNRAIFIREKHTWRFLQEEGRWSSSFSDARIFQRTWEAVDFCSKKDVRNAQLVMRFGGEEKYDVVIDVL